MGRAGELCFVTKNQKTRKAKAESLKTINTKRLIFEVDGLGPH